MATANTTSFISKFCFTFNPIPQQRAGTLEVTVRAPNMMPSQHVVLLLLDDEADSYPGPTSGWNDLTCEEQTRRAKIYHALDPLQVVQPNGQLLRFKIVEKLRPRWWYIALNDCSPESLTANFTLHAVNNAYGWASEFSADRRFVLYVFVPLAVVYACLVVLQFYANSVLADMADADDASSKAAHPFARILLAGLLLGCGATILSVIHNVLYALHGTADPITHVSAKFLYVSSDFVLASLLLLVSQGKCISYIMVAADGRRMLRLLGPFLISCFLLELWGDYSVSRRYRIDYVYTTLFGWALILVDLLLLGVYAANLRSTYDVERDRGDGAFYRTWGVAYGTWFLALPVSAVLSQAILAPYVWCIVSLAVTKTVTVLTYAALVLGLWPGNTRTYFKLFVTMENVLENCATPPSRVSWDRRAASPTRRKGTAQDDFAGAGRRQARLPTLLEAVKRAKLRLSDVLSAKH